MIESAQTASLLLAVLFSLVDAASNDELHVSALLKKGLSDVTNEMDSLLLRDAPDKRK